MDYRHPTIPASPKSDAGYLLSARWAGPEKDFAAAMARVLADMGDTPDRRA